MKKKNIISILITLLIMFMISILLFINYYNFKLSPYLSESVKINKSLNLFEERNNLSNIELYDRYFFDETYISGYDDIYLYLFDEDGRLFKKIEKSKLDLETIEDLASSEFKNSKISFLILDEKIVYVIVSDTYDVFIDIETFDEILRFRKGIADE